MASFRYTVEVIDAINGMLRDDPEGRAPVGRDELLCALEHDMGARGSRPPAGELPTQEEIRMLLGDDIETQLRFPRTTALINRCHSRR